MESQTRLKLVILWVFSKKFRAIAQSFKKLHTYKDYNQLPLSEIHHVDFFDQVVQVSGRIHA